jgi:hypothetical protein
VALLVDEKFPVEVECRDAAPSDYVQCRVRLGNRDSVARTVRVEVYAYACNKRAGENRLLLFSASATLDPGQVAEVEARSPYQLWAYYTDWSTRRSCSILEAGDLVELDVVRAADGDVASAAVRQGLFRSALSTQVSWRLVRCTAGQECLVEVEASAVDVYGLYPHPAECTDVELVSPSGAVEHFRACESYVRGDARVFWFKKVLAEPGTYSARVSVPDSELRGHPVRGLQTAVPIYVETPPAPPKPAKPAGIPAVVQIQAAALLALVSASAVYSELSRRR